MSRKSKKNITHDEMLDLAIIPNTEELYGIPNNWCWITLSSIASVISKGTTPKGGKNAYLSSGVDFLRVENICEDGTISHDNIMHIDESMHFGFLKRSVLKRGDVLVSIAGTLGKTALVRDIDLPLNTNQAVCFIRIRSDEVNKKYIKYAIDNPIIQRDLLAQTKVTAIPNLTLEIISGCPIPFPPYIEQNRIVARIDGLFAKLDEAKEKAQEVIDGFDDRRSSILSKAFSGELTEEWRKNHSFDAQALYQKIQTHLSTIKRKKQKKVHNNQKELLQAKIPKEWLLIDLDSISTQITDGEHKTPNRVQSFCGYYLLSARNVYNDSLRLDDVDYIDSEEYHRIIKRCNPQKGDILISCSGSVGRSCVVSDDNKYCMVRSAAMISQKGCNPRFIMYMLQSEPGQKQIKQLSKQTAQANLFLGAIASLVIPLPSKEEQDIVVECLDVILKKLNSAKETAEQVIEQIEVIKKAILARAFRGELGTNDPNDEPAVELLKRVLSDESTKESEPKPVKKRITIPKELSNQLGTAMERKIIRLYFEMDTDVLSLDDIFSVSSKKLDVLDCIRTLEKKQIIIQEENGKYRLVR